MAFKENYLDEIADRKYQLIDDRTGAVIYPKVKMERVDTPTQVGDKFGSKILNSIFNFFNGLLDGSVTVKNANNAPTGFNIGNADNPLKVLQLWSDKDKKIQIRPNADGSFNIELKKADGTLIKRLVSVSADGTAYLNLPWANVSGKPSTYAPTLGETSTTAYRGDKGKANATDIANIKSGTTAVGNASKFGGQLPTYYAKTSQFNNIKAIREYHVSTNPAGKNYFDIARASNECIIPMHIAGATNTISYMQYANSSVRVVLAGAVTGNVTFTYMIVYM